ncbi:MAG: tetratricopeptide repeat protein [Gammaproteobacteria bacterium]|nr:tetratricopeptide repeat protein [Gammaproteobacteria bacterium]
MTGKDDQISRAMQKGIALHQSGQVHDAIPVYRQVLASEPENPDALHLLGLAMRQQGDADGAIPFLEKAIEMQGGVAAMHSNLGNAYRDTGRDEQALLEYHKAVELDPGHQNAWYNLGIVCDSLGKPEQAIDAYDRALSINPGDAEALHNKAIVLYNQRKLDAAITGFKAAIKANRDYAAAHHHLANALNEAGRHDESILEYRAAVRIEPGTLRFWTGLAQAIRATEFTGFDAGLKSLLIDCFAKDGIDYQHLALPALSLIRNDPIVGGAFTLPADWADQDDAEIVLDDLTGRLADPLLQTLLRHCIVADEKLERLLAGCRHALLDKFSDQPGAGLESSHLCETLAIQCWFNEFVWQVNDRERQKTKALAAGLKSPINQSDAVPAGVFVLACYAPLDYWFDADQILDLARRSGNKVLQVLVREQITEPRTEAELAQDISRISDVSDDVSIAVQQQYEENPYPRWSEYTAAEAKTVAEVMRHIFPGRDCSRIASPGIPRILVAGCGTGRNAFETAGRFAGAKTLAIDLSMASLAFARRKADELGIENIQFAQADVLELATLGKRFDVIDCSGVLHHMAEPKRGWAVLAGLLRPSGLMRIGLYSDLARQSVVAARALIEESGFQATTDGIQRCRQAIFSLTADHPARPVAQSRDFFSVSLCRDLLFHVQEHRFTLPQIKEILANLDLEFLGFEHGFASSRQQYLDTYPDDSDMTSLDNWHEYEQMHPETFVGMYQFWLRKN